MSVDPVTVAILLIARPDNGEVPRIICGNVRIELRVHNLLVDPEIDFVTLMGIAGTGKTLLALAAGLAILRDTDLRDAMQALQVRMLMVMGERDTLVPVNAGRETLALCRNAQLDIIGGAGHAPFLAAPGRVVERIDRFLGETVNTGGQSIL